MTFGVALEVLRKQSNCWNKITECSANCEECECHVDASDLVEAVRAVLDVFGNGSELPNSSGDLIDRAEAQTELQFAARRYTVSCEAYGEGQVVWSDNLISVTDVMNALRKVPSVQVEQKITHCENCKHKHLEKDVWTCPFGLPGGPRFFCGYGSDIND